MRLEVAGNANQTEVFKNKIADVLQKVQISTGNGPTFHIPGKEEDASIKEVKKSVEEELCIPVKVISWSPTKFGSKTVTITVTKNQEKSLEYSMGNDWLNEMHIKENSKSLEMLQMLGDRTRCC